MSAERGLEPSFASKVAGLLLIVVMVPVGFYELMVIGFSGDISMNCSGSYECGDKWVTAASGVLVLGWLLAFVLAVGGWASALWKKKPPVRRVGLAWLVFVLSLLVGIGMMSTAEKAVYTHAGSTSTYEPPKERPAKTFANEAAASGACAEFFRETLDKLPEGWYWSQNDPPEWPVNTSVVHPETATSKDYPPLFSASFYLMNDNQSGSEPQDVVDLVRRAWLDLGWEERRYANMGDTPSREGVSENGVETNLYRADENRSGKFSSAHCGATFRRGGEDPSVMAAFPRQIKR